MALFNYQSGGLRGDGTHDFNKLRQAFAGVRTAPVVIAICEAKERGAAGNAGLLSAANVLAATLDRPYVGELGWYEHGPIGTAFLYDPTVLALCIWYNANGYPTYDDKRGVAEFQVRGTTARFLAIVEHWDPRSGATRLRQAQRIDRYGRHELPAFVFGDLNETASGPDYPARDWDKADALARAHKARLSQGVWVAQTAAVDHLIGAWDDTVGGRVGGGGFFAVPELAWQSGTPQEEAFAAAVNRDIDSGGGQLIDFMLTNRRGGLVEGIYQVHIPLAGEIAAWPSDHRLVTAAFTLAGAG